MFTLKSLFIWIITR